MSFTTTTTNGVTTVDGAYWFFTHNGTSVCSKPQQITGITSTKQTIFADDTEQDCLDEITNLGLTDPNNYLDAGD